MLQHVFEDAVIHVHSAESPPLPSFLAVRLDIVHREVVKQLVAANEGHEHVIDTLTPFFV